jgi:hypothetical protein
MMNDTTKDGSTQPAEEASVGLFDNWFDPIESALRDRVRGFIEELTQDEFEEVQAVPAMPGGRKRPMASPPPPGAGMEAVSAR